MFIWVVRCFQNILINGFKLDELLHLLLTRNMAKENKDNNNNSKQNNNNNSLNLEVEINNIINNIENNNINNNNIKNNNIKEVI